jgi:predicted NAD/FAD-dependent oxidoreductase
MAGVACARTLMQAGHSVSVFERQERPGGRMATQETPFGSFDAGAQFFTVRDARFERALQTVNGLCRPWSATSLRVLDATGQMVAAAPAPEPHWVAQPGMQSLLTTWAEPIAQAGCLHTDTQAVRLERDRLHPQGWQLACEASDGSTAVYAGFDAVLLALPAPKAHALLQSSGIDSTLQAPLHSVTIDPCWTLMLAFPQAVQPGLTTLGPQWNAARSTHHRIGWLARESSKPGRGQVERWTVQASPEWSQEHFDDTPQRVQAKLQRAFSEVTGIHAEPAWSDVRRWRHARTLAPLGRSYLWDGDAALGACGDWCLGQRVEDAFISGLELALAVA